MSSYLDILRRWKWHEWIISKEGLQLVLYRGLKSKKYVTCLVSLWIENRNSSFVTPVVAFKIWNQNLYYFLFIMIWRKTPFANGPTDSPEDILKRIGQSKFQLDTGNWTSVSSDAKV